MINRLLVTILLVVSAFPARAAEAGGMFGQGRTHLSLAGGNGYAFDKSYFVMGASASYYALDGLSIGFSFENWSGDDPGINKYAPFAQYVFYQASSTRPYVGGFYRGTAVDGLPDIDSVGGRAGIYFASGRNVYVSAGLVYESYLDCQETVYRACSESYPDFSFTIGF